MASSSLFQTFSNLRTFYSPFLSPPFGQYCLALHEENESSQEEAPSTLPSFYLLPAYLSTVVVILSPSLSNFFPFYLFQQLLLYLDAFAHMIPSEMKALFPLCSFSSYSSIKCHLFLGTLLDILKQSRTCFLCALKPLCILLC